MKTIKLLFVLGLLFKPKHWINAQSDPNQKYDTIFSCNVLKAQGVNFLSESFVKKSNFKGFKIYGLIVFLTLLFEKCSFNSSQTLVSTTNPFDN